jgi:hypothetical protein
MKSFYYIVALLLLTGCSTARMTDTWVNKEYTNYQPKKVLIVGLTDNLIARKMFEEQLKTELINRGIDAVESYDVFKPTFTSLKQTEEDIEKEVKRISNEGFDAILISAVKGVDEKVSYSGDTYRRDYYWRRFGRYYYLVQDVYLIEGYYNEYEIYHIEASLYNLKENNDKSLVWVASYDIVDPKRINTTVTNYVTAIIKSLEEKRIINENYMP